MPAMAEIRIGTSAFTAAGWENAFYPAGMKPADYLTYYATKFNTVEVDSTFYRTPSAAVVSGWARKTPDDFVFALKTPQVITHERVCLDCDEEFAEFVKVADLLGEKLGPILLQFGYFNKSAFKSLDEFLARLKPFLKKLPRDHSYALEIRNKNWFEPRFFDLLREHRVAWAWIDQSWVPRPWELKVKAELLTSDFAYVRLLGDRKGIEQQLTAGAKGKEEKTPLWEKVIVDRTAEMKSWAKYLRARALIPKTFIFANNHYQGYAPETVELFEKILHDPPK
jgi:uncharacterized protein YecE (DUF72 family)